MMIFKVVTNSRLSYSQNRVTVRDRFSSAQHLKMARQAFAVISLRAGIRIFNSKK
jgi:hypothetical protein